MDNGIPILLQGASVQEQTIQSRSTGAKRVQWETHSTTYSPSKTSASSVLCFVSILWHVDVRRPVKTYGYDCSAYPVPPSHCDVSNSSSTHHHRECQYGTYSFSDPNHWPASSYSLSKLLLHCDCYRSGSGFVSSSRYLPRSPCTVPSVTNLERSKCETHKYR